MGKRTEPKTDIAEWQAKLEEYGGGACDLKHQWPYMFSYDEHRHERQGLIVMPLDGEVIVYDALREFKQLEKPLKPGDVWGQLGAPVLGAKEASQGCYAYKPKKKGAVVRVVLLDDPAGMQQAVRDVEILKKVHDTAIDRELPVPLLEALRHHLPSVFGEASSWTRRDGVTFQRYENGEVIIGQDAAPDALYFVVAGTVRLGDVVHSPKGRWEWVHACLRPGQIFGELERPVDGQWIPLMLTATAGYKPIDRWEDLQDEPGPSILARIPFETLSRLSVDSKKVPLDLLLSRHARNSYWNWWPTLRTVGSHHKDALVAAPILRRIQQDRLERGEGDRRNEWLTRTFTTHIDLRDLLKEATGLSHKTKRNSKGSWVESLGDVANRIKELQARGIVWFDEPEGDDAEGTFIPSPSGKWLERVLSKLVRRGNSKAAKKVFHEAWATPQVARVTVHRGDALQAVGVGEFGGRDRWKGAVDFSTDVVKDFWDAAARAWISAQGDEGDTFRSEYLNAVLKKELGDLSGLTVLDAGCGEGCVSRMCARDLNPRAVWGVDVAEPLIEAARGRGGANLEFFVASLDDLNGVGTSNGEERFDAAICNLVLMDLPNHKDVIREITRVLRPGAKAVWTVLDPGVVRRTANDTCEWWLDRPGQTRPAYPPELTTDYEFAVLVELDDGFPRTPYFHRKVSSYRDAFRDVGLKVIHSAPATPFRANVKRKYQPHLKDFGIEVPVHLFVTRKE